MKKDTTSQDFVHASSNVPDPLDEDWSALKDAMRRFEDAWRQGPRPAVDDYLPASGQLRSRVLIELVHIDLELRLKAGEAARVEEYLARYPELASDQAVTLPLIAAEHEFRRRSEYSSTVGPDSQRRRNSCSAAISASATAWSLASSG